MTFDNKLIDKKISADEQAALFTATMKEILKRDICSIYRDFFPENYGKVTALFSAIKTERDSMNRIQTKQELVSGNYFILQKIRSKRENATLSIFTEIKDSFGFTNLYQEYINSSDKELLTIAASSLFLLYFLDKNAYLKLYRKSLNIENIVHELIVPEDQISIPQKNHPLQFVQEIIIIDGTLLLAEYEPSIFIDNLHKHQEIMLNSIHKYRYEKDVFNYLHKKIIDYCPLLFIEFLKSILNKKNNDNTPLNKKTTDLSSIRLIYGSREQKEVVSLLPYLVKSVINNGAARLEKSEKSIFIELFLNSECITQNNSKDVLNNLLRLMHTDLIDYKRMTEILRFNKVKTFEELRELSSIESTYTLVSKLGQGVSGTTYKIYSPETKQDFALKIINDKFNPKEAELMARLKGEDLENIAQIHDAGRHIAKANGEDKYAIVMEYVDGINLSSSIELTKQNNAFIQKRPHFISDLEEWRRDNTDPILGIFSQLLNGIASLRQYGITHRDINTANVLLNREGKVKILDFGIATDEENPTQIDARTNGVPDKKEADDLFSLGLLMYEACTGKHLVYTRETGMDHSTHAKIIYQLKQNFFDDRNKVEQIIKDSVQWPGTQTIIMSCLYGEDIKKIRKQFEEANPPLRHHFMKRDDLIDRIKELEKEVAKYQEFKIIK